MADKRFLKDQPLEIVDLVSSSDEDASGKEVSVCPSVVFYCISHYRNTPHVACKDGD